MANKKRPLNGMLSIRDIREIFGVASSTVHGWEESGLLRPTMKTKGGFRRWSVEDVEAARKRITKATQYLRRFGGGDAK